MEPILQRNNKKRERIFFVIPALVSGGAERVIIQIMTYLKHTDHQIYLALFEKRGPYLSSVPGHVTVYDLKKRGRLSVIKLIISLSRLFRKVRPDTVISFLNYANAISIISRYLSFRNFKLIISVRSYFEKELSDQRFGRTKYILYRKFFRFADAILVNSAESKFHLRDVLKIDTSRIHVIHNPVDVSGIDKLNQETIGELQLGRYILAVGRLVKPKGYSYLLKAYALIMDKIEERLVIIGDGPDEEELNGLAKDLGIQKRLVLLGFQDNPYKFMKNARIFVLSSLYEGFPNVLVEAMACGVPVISTNCRSGPSEIIEDGVTGILVATENEEALAAAMFDMLRDERRRIQFSERGKRRAQDFRAEMILPRYVELLVEQD